MSHNPDEMVAPDWMDRIFFEKVLQKYENNTKLTVSSIAITPASIVGEHFASIMFRVKIVYRTNTAADQTKSVIVKTKPFISGLKKDMFKNSSIFDVEMKMYTKTIPEMHRLLRSIGDQTTQFGPKLVYCSKEPDDLLIFEDLCEENYEVSKDPLEFDATKMVLEQIGKWHACSMYMKADRNINDEFLETYNKNMFDGICEKEIIEMLQLNFTSARKQMANWPGFEKFDSKFEYLIENISEIGKATYRINKEDEGYNVLNHSDLHLKNMMVQKNSSGVIGNVMLLDFQISVYASPAIDVYYALFAVASEETREHRDELIYLYYETFSDTLKKLGYLGKIPTMIDLQIELLKHGFLEIMAVSGFIPFFYIDFSKVENSEEIFDYNNDKMNQIKADVYSIPEVQKILKKYLLECFRKGYFQ